MTRALERARDVFDVRYNRFARAFASCDARELKERETMQTPMVGTWTIVVGGVRPFTIHGDLYYELHVTRDDDPASAGETLALRVPQHAVEGTPVVGDRLTVAFLMGQVTSAKRA